ncbi:MAG: hypothetical protein JAY75_23000 [Candidatus Thiodiazotropha taylori]|nr:hypothetical protein [Candidatus Thiodiazotropha taylori]MCG8095381.1 hypothetical protein [Candidatus Thiodiazotropha endolucinida]MCG7882935.1 hypothetical protein [Candidatus Thiodiazotropha taylori]MCG7888555.1 hypothetical protein [Candidatus Thiodiazotropha taylori]MCG7892251.1 hypothetical protein [Candidatus Thiodiazotropha taylori]
MTRFKDLVFHTDKIDLDAEIVTKAFVTKVFHLYQRRNEWVNWDGDTSLVKRTWSNFDLSLQEATDSAEKQRTQGTKFIVDEVPAICVLGKRYALLSTELFTEKPLSNCEAPPAGNTISLRDVESKLNFGRWFVSAIYTGDLARLSAVTESEMFFSRTSQSTGGKSYLGWSLIPRNIDLKRLIECSKSIEQRIK